MLAGWLICSSFMSAVAATNPSPATAASELRLFGAEIGGPEDGYELTNPATYESVKRLGADSVDIRPIWSTLEPRPGEYDWTTLDVALDLAGSKGLPVTITLRFFEEQVPEWLENENMLDQEGRPIFGYGFNDQHRGPSYWGPRARSSYLRLIAAMVRRYRDTPGILAWQFFYGYNDSFYFGMWNKRQAIYDYSDFSQEKYRKYLKREKHLGLAELNQRHGTSYEHWSEVRQPMPAFDTLNVSRAWHDFQDYRLWSIGEMFDAMDKTVRRYDDRPLIMYYGGSLHHSAHQLSVYNTGLELLKKYGGALDITCFEDPVPAEIGSGIVRGYGVPLMCEAWQVPPPLYDHRRLYFHAFALGAKSYQLVGDWANMEMPVAEFQCTAEVFKEMAAAAPVRAPVAGLISYRTIMSFIPARNYINPTLALVPKLQEHQYSLDWRSDMGPLQLEGYPALLDANSEVLAGEVIEQLGNYVEQGGRLGLLVRSGRYALEEGRPDYPLLARLQCPHPESAAVETWALGRGQVLRAGQEQDWSTETGLKTLLQVMDFLQVQRPITATPGILAALSRGARDVLYVSVFNPQDTPKETALTVGPGITAVGKAYSCTSLFSAEEAPARVTGQLLQSGLPINLASHELKVLKLTPE